MTNKLKVHLLSVLLCITIMGCKTISKDSKNEETFSSYKITLPMGGNSWVINDITEDKHVITNSGVRHWKDYDTRIRTYFKTDSIGDINLGLNLKTDSSATIKVTFGNVTREIELANTEYETVNIGSFKISKKGYHNIEIQGLQKTGNVFADIDDVLIGGPLTSKNITYVPDDFHFGRRGPSVHLKYDTPQNKDILYFYNEITVPKGEDVIGSYYMANGFGQGYFGMQVNSDKERRVLFSVWSEFDTQDPNQIPKEYQVNLLGKGKDVHAGKFGNEGSGAQSYLIKNWEADITYKFLLKINPSVNNSSDYTAYFFDPKLNDWELIASFRRPKTSTYITNMYSFLENFSPSTGYITRQANYSNQWVYTTKNEWIEITEAKFTYDATARKKSRLDYAGGVSSHTFFLKDCGFFNENTSYNAVLKRIPTKKQPSIDFSKLQKPSL